MPAAGELRALTGLRIVLATWIVVHHATRFLLEAGAVDPTLAAPLRQGQAGTAGFFVLSGLALAWCYGATMAREDSLARIFGFLRRRWASVWPLGAVGALLGLPYELLAGRMDGGAIVAAFAANLLLVQSWLPLGGGEHGFALRLNGPTWTLSTLLALYLSFPILARLVDRHARTRMRLLTFGVAPWACVTMLALLVTGEEHARWLLHVHPFVRVADFAAGVALGTALVRHGRPGRRLGWVLQPLAAGLVALSVATLAWQVSIPAELRYTAWPLPTVVLLCWSLAATGGPLAALLGSRPIARAGRYAFALLMVHNPILGIFRELGLLERHPIAAVATAVALAVPLAIAAHHLVEVPGRRRLRGPGRHRRGAASAASR